MITSQHLLVTRSWNPPTATPSAPSHSTCWERLAGAEWLDYVSPSDVESLQNVSVYTLYVHIPRKTFPPAALGSELRSCSTQPLLSWQLWLLSCPGLGCECPFWVRLNCGCIQNATTHAIPSCYRQSSISQNLNEYDTSMMHFDKEK